jgi:hypothetical protein
MPDGKHSPDPLALQHANEMRGTEIPPERITAAHLAALRRCFDQVFPLEDAGAPRSEASGLRFDVDVHLDSLEVRPEGLYVRLSLREQEPAAEPGGAL